MARSLSIEEASAFVADVETPLRSGKETPSIFGEWKSFALANSSGCVRK